MTEQFEAVNVHDLAAEALSAKHRRLMQDKCAHEEIYSSAVRGPLGFSENRFCLDCGKSWHSSKGCQP